MDLIVASYALLYESHASFSSKIAFCLYQYYCVFLLWRRLPILKNHFYGLGFLSHDPLLDIDLPVPPHLYEYLLCLGFVTDPFGALWMPNVVQQATWQRQGFPEGPCHPPHFTTFEVMPYPIISLLKIKNDLLFTLTGAQDPFWKIDSVYISAPGSWCKPNRHILGYYPSHILSILQIDHLVAAGFPTSEDACNQSMRPLSRVRLAALQLVANVLNATFPSSPLLPVPNNPNGSLS